MDKFSIVNNSLLSFITFPSSVSFSLLLSSYIHSSRKLCFKKSLTTIQGLFFLSFFFFSFCFVSSGNAAVRWIEVSLNSSNVFIGHVAGSLLGPPSSPRKWGTGKRWRTRSLCRWTDLSFKTGGSYQGDLSGLNYLPFALFLKVIFAWLLDLAFMWLVARQHQMCSKCLKEKKKQDTCRTLFPAWTF